MDMSGKKANIFLLRLLASKSFRKNLGQMRAPLTVATLLQPQGFIQDSK
jgi:hypothetical protein